ncbi:hypothetical protein VPH35_121705 [Triticum aestivum]
MNPFLFLNIEATTSYNRETEELMNKNALVQAIIWPQTSAEVELFASMAKHNNIPDSFSLCHHANIDNSQLATPIAAILEAFAWHSAILLHEDSPYGISILSALVHAFQGSRGLTDSVAVPADATDSRLDVALLAIKAMPVRVYIVHMLPALAVRLFHRAMVLGMMSEGYVWISTTDIGEAAYNLGGIDNMQGVVSLRPHVQETDQVKSFSRRMNVRLSQDSTATDDPSAPMSLIWLYDTAWAAAAAAEVSFRSAERTTFLDALVAANFDGLAGRFRLVDGQRQVLAYEIVNAFSKGERTVGFWTPGSGITTSLDLKSAGKELKQIVWPGETAAVPIGWSMSPNGRLLRVAVPVKRGFSQFVEISSNPSSATERVTGYCIDVFHAVMTKLKYPVVYSYSYERLVELVPDKKADAVVGDVTITASRMKLVSFTMPFADTGWSMIVAEQDNSNSMWIFVKPLTSGLWLTSLAFFFFTGFVVWAIEHKDNPRFHGTPWNQFGILMYFAFSTMVFSHKEKLESNLSKFVVIMWVFVVLILTTSYTANLSSILTIRHLQPAINNLREWDYVGYQEGSFIGGILKEMGFEEARLRTYSSMDQYAGALKKGSDNGGITAIFDEVPYLRLFLSRYCEGYSMAGPTYKSGGFGFLCVFPMGSPLAVDVSRAILELAEEDKLARIENKWFGHPGACVGRGNGGADARLGLWRFGGLFLTNGIVSCLMLLIHLAKFLSVAAGALTWLRACLRCFDAFQGPRGQPVSNSRRVDEPNHQGLADGSTEQEGATGDSIVSAPVDYSDYRRNSASAPVPEQILAPIGAV